MCLPPQHKAYSPAIRRFFWENSKSLCLACLRFCCFWFWTVREIFFNLQRASSQGNGTSSFISFSCIVLLSLSLSVCFLPFGFCIIWWWILLAPHWFWGLKMELLIGISNLYAMYNNGWCNSCNVWENTLLVQDSVLFLLLLLLLLVIMNGVSLHMFD